tara:strand:+ start:104 stop:439 length:336 start_codon:yes stop_codon:yes gene_type:complete
MPKKKNKMRGTSQTSVRGTLTVPFGHKSVKNRPPELGITVSQRTNVPGFGSKKLRKKTEGVTPTIWASKKYSIGKGPMPVSPFEVGVNVSGKITKNRKLPKLAKKSSKKRR